MKHHLILTPPQAFIDRCEQDGVKPERVLKGFIADLCELYEGDYLSNGSDERMKAEEYYNRVGYQYWKECK